MTRTAIRPAQAAPWLTPLARWLRRKRWAANVARCDRIRSGLSFSRRLIFDDEVRPFLDDGTRIAYPDAFYFISVDDVCRALMKARLAR